MATDPTKVDRKWLRGEWYELVLLRVDLRNEDGTPLTCTIVRAKDVVELSDEKQDNHFITAWVHQRSLRKPI